jgi:hypothetical protein
LIPLIGLNGFVQVKFMKGFSADAKVCSNTTASAIHDSSMLSIKHFHLKKNEEKSSNFVQDLGEKYLKTPRYC